MVDPAEKFDLTLITNQSGYGPYGIGIMLRRAGECVGRQACCIANEDCGMELQALKFPPTGTTIEAADAIKSFLMEYRVKPGARVALQALEDAIRKGEFVLGSDVLIGHECNA